MKKELQQVIADARRWVEQERAWDDSLYATASEKKQSDVPTKRMKDATAIRPAVAPSHSSRTPVPFSSSASRPTLAPPRVSMMDANQKAAALQALFDKYNTCTRCPLGNSRLKFVFGVGNPDAEVLFIGEGPGYEEDHRGEPFIGRAGQLLDKMMEAISLSRKSVYIANIVKCHAMINPQTPHEHGNDRAPTPQEAETCAPILQQQIAVIQPRIIVTLGSPSTRTVLGTLEGISKVRGRFFPMPMTFFRVQINESDLFDEKKNDDFMGFKPEQLELLKTIQVLPIYHPAALLRNPNLKKDTWEDMKLLRNTLQKPA